MCTSRSHHVVGGSGVPRPDDDEVTMIDRDESDAEVVGNENARNAAGVMLFMRGFRYTLRQVLVGGVYSCHALAVVV